MSRPSLPTWAFEYAVSLVARPALRLLPPKIRVDGEASADDDLGDLGGPGWYDSSWDLSCGLDVAEVPQIEAVLDGLSAADLRLSPA